LDHLDQVRVNLPRSFKRTSKFCRDRGTILAKHEYAQEIIRAGEQEQRRVPMKSKLFSKKQELEAFARVCRKSVQQLGKEPLLRLNEFVSRLNRS